MQEQVVEIVNEKFDAKINDLDDKINTINETVISTVQNQIETQSKEIENKCLATVDKQIEMKTKFEINKQIDIKTTVLQDQLENFESNVISIAENIETVSKAISEHADNTNCKISTIQSKLREIDEFRLQTSNNIYDKCNVIENNLMSVKNELRGEFNKKFTGVTERAVSYTHLDVYKRQGYGTNNPR